MPQLENFRLKVFRTVAEHLNFRKAAEHLFLTQPAITLQIKALEDDLGIRLFDRAGNRVALTSQGSVLLVYAKKIAALVSEAEQELGAEDGKISGELTLGVSTTIAQYVLPRLLGAFLDEHPRVQFSLHSGNTSEIVHLLLDNKISVGLIEGPARDRGIRTEPFMQDELVRTGKIFGISTAKSRPRNRHEYCWGSVALVSVPLKCRLKRCNFF